MSEQELPKLAFDPFKHLACARHAEPFRAEYPSGFVVFTMGLMKEAFANEEVQRLARSMDDGWEERLLAALADKPACEWTEPDVLKRLYRTARSDWSFGVCENCRLAKKGAPFETRWAGIQQKKSHVCFDCVVDFMVPANPNDR